jgi:hypothetical protein
VTSKEEKIETTKHRSRVNSNKHLHAISGFRRAPIVVLAILGFHAALFLVGHLHPDDGTDNRPKILFKKQIISCVNTQKSQHNNKTLTTSNYRIILKYILTKRDVK